MSSPFEEKKPLVPRNLSSDELDRLKAAFLAIISHELRTPLTEIMAAASILGDGFLGGLTEDQHRYLVMIENSANHLNELIQDLLSFAQLQSDVVEILGEPGELNEIALAAVKLYRAQMEQKKLLMLTRLTPELPRIPLDRTKMIRVVSNLISNAINFTGEGGRIMVRTRVAEEGQVIDVADTGVGIPKDKLPQVFDSFYQAEDPLTRQIGGLGIGLAYARRIVEAHRGRISVQSIEGRGSIFSVWLPARADVETDGTKHHER